MYTILLYSKPYNMDNGHCVILCFHNLMSNLFLIQFSCSYIDKALKKKSNKNQ